MSSSSKTVLVTGATRGFVKHYINVGWKVIGTGCNVKQAHNVGASAKSLSTLGDTNTTVLHQLKALSPCKIVRLDTSDEDIITQMAKELDGIPIDVFINNAGILEEVTTKGSFMRHFEINSVGPFLCCTPTCRHEWTCCCCIALQPLG
ncbi:unnamed protein product [Phytophthora lilii]|uniref:Unnamed protein product n=1 Tax=Phytophthora lilii TaxID=2077276 RepID=A0A9W6U115_9STRA|nr:unnamed protein product [Phytophthora lilii]